MPTLVAHGRLIVATLPGGGRRPWSRAARGADGATRRGRCREPISTTIAGPRRAPGSSVSCSTSPRSLLLAYLGLPVRAPARQRANARRAARAPAGAPDFERLIAGISAQFIDLPPDRVDDGIKQALARLGDHAGGGSRLHPSVRRRRTRRRALASLAARGHRAPSGWPRSLLDAGSLGASIVRASGCIHVPSRRRASGGPEKPPCGARHPLLALPPYVVRRQAGRFPRASMRFAAEKRWSDDDIALLRTAGEIFANALERERGEARARGPGGAAAPGPALEAIGTLAGGIAHDFNNILGAILGYARNGARPRCPRTAARGTTCSR